QVPSALDNGASEIAAHQFASAAFGFDNEGAGAAVFNLSAVDTSDFFQGLPYALGLKVAIARRYFQQHCFRVARERLKIDDRIRRHHATLVDDDDLLAGLLHFRQDVRAENDGVLAGEVLDQIAGFVDLLGIEAS